MVFVLLAYKFITQQEFNNNVLNRVLKFLGDISFGIYFSHLAVMMVLKQLPFYSHNVKFPVNAIAALVVSSVCIHIARKILGKYSRYLAL